MDMKAMSGWPAVEIRCSSTGWPGRTAAAAAISSGSSSRDFWLGSSELGTHSTLPLTSPMMASSGSGTELLMASHSTSPGPVMVRPVSPRPASAATVLISSFSCSRELRMLSRVCSRAIRYETPPAPSMPMAVVTRTAVRMRARTDSMANGRPQTRGARARVGGP